MSCAASSYDRVFIQALLVKICQICTNVYSFRDITNMIYLRAN